MGLIEIATIAISVITVAIAIYKAAKNGTLLTTVIKGVEASTTPGSHIKTTIAHHAEKAGLKYALHKVVKKITDKLNSELRTTDTKFHKLALIMLMTNDD